MVDIIDYLEQSQWGVSEVPEDSGTLHPPFPQPLLSSSPGAPVCEPPFFQDHLIFSDGH